MSQPEVETSWTDEASGLRLARSAAYPRVPGAVGLEGVPLTGKLRRSWALGVLGMRAWTWEPADRRDRQWWPQGITSAGEGDAGLLVSWYSKQGLSRLSVVDTRTGWYAHVALAVPALADDGSVALGPLKVHAGGLARTGRWLHGAATAKGFWTAHLDDVVEVDGELVLPVRHAHRASAPDGVEPLRYSFMSAGSSGLVVGEYARGKRTRRLARIPVDPATGLPCGAPVVAGDGPAGMQGAVERDGRWSVTTSHGPWTPGSLWTGSPDALVRRRWATPMGPEDLYADAGGDLWTVTEHPRRRWIVRLSPSRR
ncbi:hypothetical protein [Nocardioides salarius]|uniref:hypothetical protein n=1 Tax=Nocardioides salarius TaxID=374513 RepID=UPI0030FC695D